MPQTTDNRKRELAVSGWNAVSALAEYHPELIKRFFCEEEYIQSFGRLCSKLASWKRIYRVVGKEELAKVSSSIHNQGVCAVIDKPSLPRVDEDSVAEAFVQSVLGKRVLILDHVENAHNLGAIIRSAAFLGLESLLIASEDADAALSAPAWRAAEGGMEHLEIWTVQNLPRFMRRHPEVRVIAADQSASRPLRSVLAENAVNKDFCLAIALGNEEIGLSEEVLEAAHDSARIEGCGKIESLNVAQTASICIYEMLLGDRA